MFFRHDFLSKSNNLHIFSSCFSSCFPSCFPSCSSSCFSLCFSSWLSIKSFYQTAFMISRHDFFSWLFFIAFLHDFSIITSLHSFSSWLLYHDSSIMTLLSWLFFMTFYHIVFMFPVMTSIKKIMQKQKTGKISIFSSLDVKLEFLTSQVELTQFSVESSWIKLKIWATRLWIELNSKCQFETQLDDQSMLKISIFRLCMTILCHFSSFLMLLTLKTCFHIALCASKTSAMYFFKIIRTMLFFFCVLTIMMTIRSIFAFFNALFIESRIFIVFNV